MSGEGGTEGPHSQSSNGNSLTSLLDLFPFDLHSCVSVCVGGGGRDYCRDSVDDSISRVTQLQGNI